MKSRYQATKWLIARLDQENPLLISSSPFLMEIFFWQNEVLAALNHFGFPNKNLDYFYGIEKYVKITVSASKKVAAEMFQLNSLMAVCLLFLSTSRIYSSQYLKLNRQLLIQSSFSFWILRFRWFSLNFLCSCNNPYFPIWEMHLVYLQCSFCTEDLIVR